MALAEATHHAAPRRLKPANAITVNDAPLGQKNAGAEHFELSSDEEVAPAAGSAWGATAAGAGTAADRGADGRVLRACARSQRSCAADGGTDGGCPADPRHVHACRAGVPRRPVLREPEVEEVPVPETVVLAHGRDAAGRTWLHVHGPRGACWWMLGSSHVQWRPPDGLTASPGRCTNTGRRAHPKDPGADRGGGSG